MDVEEETVARTIQGYYYLFGMIENANFFHRHGLAGKTLFWECSDKILILYMHAFMPHINPLSTSTASASADHNES